MYVCKFLTKNAVKGGGRLAEQNKVEEAKRERHKTRTWTLCGRK